MKFNLKNFPKSVEYIFYFYISIRYSMIDMYPSSSIGNGSDSTSKRYPVQLLAWDFFLYKNVIKNNQYIRMTLMQSKGNKMSNFFGIYEEFISQALKESLKKLKEYRSLRCLSPLSSFKTGLKAVNRWF